MHVENQKNSSVAQFGPFAQPLVGQNSTSSAPFLAHGPLLEKHCSMSPSYTEWGSESRLMVLIVYFIQILFVVI